MEAADLLKKQVAEVQLVFNFKTNTAKQGQMTAGKLKARSTLLDKYWKDVLERHLALSVVKDQLEEEDYFVNDVFSTAETTYMDNVVELEAALAALQGPQVAATYDVQQPGTVRLTTVHSPSLPRPQLPTFTGDRNEWETFKEKFTHQVKNVTQYTDIEKLECLLSCVKGDAARQLNNIPITGPNLTVAWDNLCRRYDFDRSKLTAHMNRLLNLAPASRTSSDELARLIDTVAETKRALEILKRPTDHWDDWLVTLVVARLDNQTKCDWHKSLENTTDYPTYNQLQDFIEKRIRTLEDSQENKPKKDSTNAKKPSKSGSALSIFNTSASPQAGSKGCALCGESHFISYCTKFRKMQVQERRKVVADGRLCYNCLRAGHLATDCPNQGRCRSPGCNQAHHTMLHLVNTTKDATQGSLSASSTAGSDTQQKSTSNSSDQADSSSSTLAAYSISSGRTALMATALIKLVSPSGETLTVRALLDPAADASLLTDRAAQALGLKKKRHRTGVGGIGGEVNLTSHFTSEVVVLSSLEPNFSLGISVFILERLTTLLPRHRCLVEGCTHLDGLALADPKFLEPQEVDCILGLDAYPYIIRTGVRIGQPGQPIAQQTAFGWVITGAADSLDMGRKSISVMHASVSDCSLSMELRRFWEIEGVSSKRTLTKEEAECEAHFASTHSRTEEGRYMVKLPFAKQPEFPGSRHIATRCFLQVEQRLAKNEELRNSYTAFMQEFLDLKHMEPVPKSEVVLDNCYYLPHHAVVKQDGSGKIRVVFNASQPAVNGLSLNQVLHTGPKLQSDIFSILSKWRWFRFVFTADIIKMFRQFLVDPGDTDWQRILWRSSPNEQLETMRMSTVIYGTNCAPYLAIRILLQLAQDEECRFPLGAEVLRNHMYVDDALCGAHTVNEARECRDQLIGILESACIKLDKWSTNHPALLQGIGSIVLQDRIFDDSTSVSTLGLRWNPSKDVFFFRVNLSPPSELVTKRTLLAEVARLFDPLGWIAPVVVLGKIFMQTLWLKGVDWDQPVDGDLLVSWNEYREQLPQLEQIKIPRWLGATSSPTWYLHGFSDASQRAYSAVIYFVALTPEGGAKSMLMSAKTRVAPMKTVSIPRLELLGAELLSDLITGFASGLQCPPAKIFCWSDSSVVLAWLDGHPSRWQTFVANRVSKIRTAHPEASWSHVSSALNPADLASRGMLPSDLLDNSLWWTGPEWLTSKFEEWPTASTQYKTDLERRKEASVLVTQQAVEQATIETAIARFSSLNRMIAVYSCFYFWKRYTKTHKRSHVRLGVQDRTASKQAIIKQVQRLHFPLECHCLATGKSLPPSSRLLRFVPFLDKAGVMRIGGRLQNSFLSEEEKHPAILPKQSHFSELVLRDAHRRTGHGGEYLMASHIIRAYWILHVKSSVRRITHQCIACTRHRAKTLEQQMAPLPSDRVRPQDVFGATGVDYCGPFAIRTAKGRGQKTYKGYVAVFVCMVTRAIHLEVASDCTTMTFLAALQRFISRRGLPSTMYSDNGPNLRGADNEIRRLFLDSSEEGQEIAAAALAKGIQWNFIPPRASHFGGLWEAGVKSFKYHLKRIAGDSSFTYEELSTLTAQIEACLNSRPLSPLSTDPQDVAALTPGHFLIGRALTALPEPNDDNYQAAGIDFYIQARRMRNHFWKRWQTEVLQQHLQQSKWTRRHESAKVGDLVLICDDRCSATQWPLARVLECIQGKDGLVRVLRLKTATKETTSPIVKVVRLPVDEAPPPAVKESGDSTGGGSAASQPSKAPTTTRITRSASAKTLPISES